jgi:catechol 2,3-dioxygenase-like lactoylglutathione lyase family enzyme
MSRIRLIHHVNVPISNRERTREWYEKVLER